MANVKLNVDVSKTLDVRHIWSIVVRVEPGMEEWESVKLINKQYHNTQKIIIQYIVQHRCVLSTCTCTGGISNVS